MTTTSVFSPYFYCVVCRQTRGSLELSNSGICCHCRARDNIKLGSPRKSYQDQEKEVYVSAHLVKEIKEMAEEEHEKYRKNSSLATWKEHKLQTSFDLYEALLPLLGKRL